MGYISLVTQKVAVKKGNKVEYVVLKPKDPVPEGVQWANPAIWIARGYIAPDKNQAVPRGNFGANTGMRAMTPADYKAREKRKKQILETGELPERMATEFFPAAPGNIGPVSDVPLEDEVASTDDDITLVPEDDAPPAAGEPAGNRDELLELSKKDLMKMAKKLKLDVSAAMKKEEIADAILAMEKE